MAKTLGELRQDIQRRLGDEDEKIWSATDLNGHIRQGYNETMIRTRALWKSVYIDDVALQAVYDLPADLYFVERVTWDDKRIEPLTSTALIKYDYRFTTMKGIVEAYSMDLDGLRKIRKYRVPVADSPSAPTTGTFGISRELSAVDSSTVQGSWGIPRKVNRIYNTVPEVNAWGIPRRFPGTIRTTKVEYYARGPELKDDDKAVELPDWMIFPIRHYVMWHAYERDGEGHNDELASFFQQLYEYTLKRINVRREANRGKRVGVFGGRAGREIFAGPPRPKLPWQYGKIVR